MRATIGLRLIVVYATIATATAFLALWVGGMLVRRDMIRESERWLDLESREIELLLSAAPDPATPESIDRLLGDHTLLDASVFFFQVEDRAQRVLFRSRNLAGASLESVGTAQYSSAELNLPLHRADASAVPIRVARYRLDSFVVKIGSSLVAQRAVARQFRWIMALVVPSVFVLSLGVGHVLSRFMLGPLRSIQETAKRIGANNLNERIPIPDSNDELSRLVELLNQMFDRIEKSFEQVRRFTADSSHELKTPLSIMRLHAEKLLEDRALGEAQRHGVADLLGELGRLDRVINQLLFLAKSESESLPLEFQRVATVAYMDQFREDAEILCENAQCRFQLTENTPMNARVDPSWIRQCLFNLLSNAIKHSPRSGCISIRSVQEGSVWRCAITDEGPGVRHEDLLRIFERFTKLNESSDGAGLGLSVCQSIIERHGGRIWAERGARERGLMVIFELPI